MVSILSHWETEIKASMKCIGHPEEWPYYKKQAVAGLVHLYCQFDLIYSYLRDISLGISTRVFLERFNWGKQTHPDPTDWDHSQNKKEKRRKLARTSFHPSLFPGRESHATTALGSCCPPPWQTLSLLTPGTKTKLSFLKLLLKQSRGKKTNIKIGLTRMERICNPCT